MTTTATLEAALVKEAEVIPEGISMSESLCYRSVFIQHGNQRLVCRYRKDNSEKPHMSVEMFSKDCSQYSQRGWAKSVNEINELLPPSERV